MEFTIKSDLDPIAFIAIALAMASLLWHVVVYFLSGARLRLSVMPSAISIIPGMGSRGVDKRKRIVVSVSNVGDRPTTIDFFSIEQWDSWWARLTRVHPKCYIVPMLEGGRLPHKIESGEKWTAMAFIEGEIQEELTGKLAYVIVRHAVSKRPKRIRLKLPEKNHS